MCPITLQMLDGGAFRLSLSNTQQIEQEVMIKSSPKPFGLDTIFGRMPFD